MNLCIQGWNKANQQKIGNWVPHWKGAQCNPGTQAPTNSIISSSTLYHIHTRTLEATC